MNVQWDDVVFNMADACRLYPRPDLIELIALTRSIFYMHRIRAMDFYVVRRGRNRDISGIYWALAVWAQKKTHTLKLPEPIGQNKTYIWVACAMDCVPKKFRSYMRLGIEFSFMIGQRLFSNCVRLVYISIHVKSRPLLYYYALKPLLAPSPLGIYYTNWSNAVNQCYIAQSMYGIEY